MTPTLSSASYQMDETFFTIAPNPTNNKQIQLSFTLEETQNATVTIYDSLGRTIKEVEMNELNSGLNYQTIDASNLNSGMYFCKLSTPNGNKSLRVTIK